MTYEEIKGRVVAEKPTLGMFLKWAGTGQRMAYRLHEEIRCFPELDAREARADAQRAAFVALGLDEKGRTPTGYRALSGDAETDHVNFAGWRSAEAARLEDDGTVSAIFADSEGYGLRRRVVAVIPVPAPEPAAPRAPVEYETDAYGNVLDGEEYE